MVARNDSDDLILQAFVQEYGPTVLAEPPTKGFNLGRVDRADRGAAPGDIPRVGGGAALANPRPAGSRCRTGCFARTSRPRAA